MNKIKFEFRGNIFELIEELNFFDEESILIFENEKLIGSVEKLHKNEIHIIAQRILSDKYSYREMGVYA